MRTFVCVLLPITKTPLRQSDENYLARLFSNKSPSSNSRRNTGLLKNVVNGHVNNIRNVAALVKKEK